MKSYKDFTGYRQALANRNMVFLATVGSTMLGLSRDEKSDVDEMGVCFETPAQLLGFAPFESDVYRSAQERTGKHDAKSEPGDVDLTIYGLRKFVRLALGGNPNLFSLLYLPQAHFSTYTPVAEELQNLAPSFASKAVGKAFLGYMQAQRMRLEGTRGQMRVNRDELVEAHGYDTKFAMHALRLAMQGYTFMRKGKLTFPLSDDYVAFLTDVRKGNINYSSVRDNLQAYEDDLRDSLASNSTQLPDKPDYDRIEQWLLNVYKRGWCDCKAETVSRNIKDSL